MQMLLVLTLLVKVSLGKDLYTPHWKEDCPGHDIEEEEYTDIVKCLDRCDALVNCVAVTRNDGLGICSFKHTCDLDNLKPSPFVMYSKSPGPFQHLPFVDCPYNDIKFIQNLANVVVCKWQCVKTQGCVAVVYNGGKCWLKRSCKNFITHKIQNTYLLLDCKGNLGTGTDCVSRGNMCKPPNECKKTCEGKCHHRGTVCCCKDEDTGKTCGAGNVCKPIRQCKKECPGTCLPGTVCCCKEEDTGKTCESGGNVCKPVGKCKKTCAGTCKFGTVCCCKRAKKGKTCASRGNICTAPAECTKKCKGTCPKIGAVCCCKK